MTGVRAPNITGAVFGRLTVLHRHGRNRNAATWLCVCKCGTETIAEARMLRRGTTQSCGCLRRESVIAVSNFLWQRLFRDEWPIKRALQR